MKQDIEPKSLIKSRERVTNHGEVFTSEREVNAMLDLVKQETLRIDSRFLEPACGDGNFLIEVLRRKLSIVKERYRKSQPEYERNAITAISSLYGVDILLDNAEACRERLYYYFVTEYKSMFKQNINDDCLKSVQYILKRNILWGDALTMKSVCGNHDPIIFSEWISVNGTKIKRRDYSLAHLLAYQPMDELNLFSDLGDQAFIPKPVKEYPLCHFLKVWEQENV